MLFSSGPSWEAVRLVCWEEHHPGAMVTPARSFVVFGQPAVGDEG